MSNAVAFARALGKQLGVCHTSAFAGSLAYRTIFAIAPAGLLLVFLLGSIGAQDALLRLLDELKGTIPNDALDLLRQFLEPIVTADEAQQSRYTVGALIAVLLAVWAISGLVRSIIEALNVMHGAEEDRPFVRKTLLSIGLALALAVFAACGIGLIMLGPDAISTLLRLIGLGEVDVSTWFTIVRWPLGLLFIQLAIAIMYQVAPNVEVERFRVWTRGSLFATASWVVFSAAFSVYIQKVGSFGATFGALAGLVIFILYVYYSSFILLLGAQIDHLHRSRTATGWRARLTSSLSLE